MQAGEYHHHEHHAASLEKPPIWADVPPRPREHLFGREELLTELAARLVAGQSPTLSTDGMPGVGKTALAIELAYHPQIREHFDGVLWGGLGEKADVANIQAGWARALGLENIGEIQDERARTQAISSRLAGRRVLVMLDDCWDVAAAETLRCSGDAIHLLTTRDKKIARDFARSTPIHVPPLAEDPGFALLQSLAPAACAADPAAARALAEAVGGLPLALEVLGGYLGDDDRQRFAELRAQDFADMADPKRRLAAATTRLAGQGMRRNLDKIIGLSVEELQGQAPAAAQAFAALGAFAAKPARFDAAAAQAVAACDATVLALLVARNLLEMEDDDAPAGALALHQVLADAARQQTTAAARARHREHYLALVDEDRQDWQRIEAVYPQIVYAWNQYADEGEEEKTLLQFVWSLRVYQERRGLWQDKIKWSEAALNFAQSANDLNGAASMFVNLGYVYSDLGEKQKALEYYEQALPLYRQVGDRSGEATTLNNMGRVYSDLGEKQKALEYYEQALPLYRQVGDRSGEATTLNNMGRVYSDLGEKQKALEYYEQALPLYRQVGDRSGEATTLNNMGRVYSDLGEKQKALEYYEQALPLYRQVGDRSGEATTLNNMGGVYLSRGDIENAIKCGQDAAAIFGQIGDIWSEALLRFNLGYAFMSQSKWAEAEKELRRAVEIGEAVGHPDTEQFRQLLTQVQAQK